MLTDEQKRLRLTGVGGSECAAVVGLNPYMTALDVYRSKTEPGYTVEVTPPMERGTFLEDGIAKWFAHRTGSVLREVGTIRHPHRPVVLCTPDRLATKPGEEEIDLSIKSPGPYVRDQWGEDGTDMVPESALVQAQWELIPLGVLYGIRRAKVAAPIDGDLRIYPILADENIQGMLVERVEKFWVDHVLKRVPPPLDGSESCSEWLASRFPQHIEKAPVFATPEAEKWARYLLVAKADLESAEQRKAEAINHLKEICGDAPGIEGSAWRASWRNNKASVSTDWEAIAKELNPPPHLIARHTKEKPGPRVFRPTFQAGRDD